MAGVCAARKFATNFSKGRHREVTAFHLNGGARARAVSHALRSDDRRPWYPTKTGLSKMAGGSPGRSSARTLSIDPNSGERGSTANVGAPRGVFRLNHGPTRTQTP